MNRNRGNRRLLSIPLFTAIGSWIVTSLTALGLDAIPSSGTENGDDDRAHQVAQEVFRANEYWWKRTAEVKSNFPFRSFLEFLHERILAPVLNAILDVLKWVLSWFSFSLGESAGGLPWVEVIVAALAILVAWWGYLIFRRRRDRVSAIPLPMHADRLDVLPRFDQLLEEARSTLMQGDHRQAIRFTFLSMLAWLQDQGKLRYDPARSNREYQSDLLRWPESVAGFRLAAEPFEHCWYGGRDLSSEQVLSVISFCQTQYQLAKGGE